MKNSRIIFAAALAAMTMASCQKQEPASESQNLKSVEIKISNVFPGTKAIGGLDYDLEGKNIQLNSLQLFFSDGTTLYEAKDATGVKADVYFDSNELAAMNGNISAKFHFLPSAVKKVIAVGNYTEQLATSEAALNRILEIDNYQDVTNFPLYSEGALTVYTANDHNNGNNAHLSNVYSVNLDILPHVARFEVTGIGATLPTGSQKIIKVVSMAFADFYNNCDFRTCALSTLRSIDLTNQQTIYNYFQNQMSPAKWNNDFFNGNNGQQDAGNSHPVLEFTAQNSYVKTDIAYNFFCKGAQAPTLVLNVIEYENQAALEENNGTPGYLYTNSYKLNSGEAVNTFDQGKIYRMDIRFTEDDLQHQERCLDITLNIARWIVVNVIPEF